MKRLNYILENKEYIFKYQHYVKLLQAVAKDSKNHDTGCKTT